MPPPSGGRCAVILDLYEVKQVFTGGGMGLVYHVRHRGWNMDMAVKRPRAEYFATEAHRENFVREAETWVNLGLHPHTVSCYYVRTVDGVPCVFAEFIEGGSLADWIGTRTLYEGGSAKALERILDIAIQFAWGLHYAHEQGLVHQDVKPANLLMTPDGTAKVTDFGLAKARAVVGEAVAAPAQQSILASYGGMTLAYCSPEQAEIAALRKMGTPYEALPKLTRRTDIWSWAVSVFEMLCGELPCEHGGQTAGEVFDGYLEEEPSEGFLPKIPPSLAELLKSCFRRSPDERPKNMAEIAGVVRGIYEAVTGNEYLRLAPKPTDLLADSLNNRALSVMDLGKPQEAEETWHQALQADAHHLESVYNFGLFEWRTARIDDVELARRLREAGTNARPPRLALLVAQVELESGDAETAVSLLEQVDEVDREGGEMRSVLAYALQRLQEVPRCLRAFQGHTLRVNSVCLSLDGRWALSGSLDDTLRLWDVLDGSVCADP